MPPIQGNLTVSATWQNAVTNGKFGTRNNGPSSLTFNQAKLNLTTFNTEWAGDITIASGGHVDFDVTSPPASLFTPAGYNLNAESVNFGHLLSMVAVVSGSSITLTPASSNPIEWFFGTGPPASSTIPVSGMFAYSDTIGSTGYATSGTHKTFRIANVGAGNCTVGVEIKGSQP